MVRISFNRHTKPNQQCKARKILEQNYFVARVVKDQVKKKGNRKPVTLMYEINWNAVSCVVHKTLINQESFHGLPNNEGTQILNGMCCKNVHSGKLYQPHCRWNEKKWQRKSKKQ